MKIFAVQVGKFVSILFLQFKRVKDQEGISSMKINMSKEKVNLLAFVSSISR